MIKLHAICAAAVVALISTASPCLAFTKERRIDQNRVQAPAVVAQKPAPVKPKPVVAPPKPTAKKP